MEISIETETELPNDPAVPLKLYIPAGIYCIL